MSCSRSLAGVLAVVMVCTKFSRRGVPHPNKRATQCEHLGLEPMHVTTPNEGLDHISVVTGLAASEVVGVTR